MDICQQSPDLAAPTRDSAREIVAAIVNRAGCDVPELVQRLRPHVDAHALATFASIGLAGTSVDPKRELDELIPAEQRATGGIYFTPPELARTLASHLDPNVTGTVLDLACGDGALLCAVAERCPNARLIGVEREPLLAVAAAERLLRICGPESKHLIHCGDGLAVRPELEGAAAVIGNPPYVGEKGNRDVFRAVREVNPHLEPYFGPRIDLHYLFLHRATDLLAPGGTLIQLTSEYWLTATGARHLRRHLATDLSVRRLDQLGPGAFASAPGHHSLILVADKDEDRRHFDLPKDGTSWTPFAKVARLEGIPLGEVCDDRQGFVSGADRVTRRSASALGRPPGTPIFLWNTDEIPAGDEDLFRPVLRRSDCVANRIWRETPGDEHVLWADSELPDTQRAKVEAILEPFRAVLEARREVRLGRMPWYRIWWPRNTEEYARPKLVVPRRATGAAFCLDLSGAHISSDCTFLLCRDRIDEIPTLLAVMLVANSAPSLGHLRAYGKSKGDVVEFYSDPLRRLPLGLVEEDGRLVPRCSQIRRRWEAALEQLETGSAFRDV